MRTRLCARLGIVAALVSLLPPPIGAAVAPETAQLPVADLVARASALLASGQNAQSIELLDLVIERDPSYVNLYKRAAAHRALGQERKALQDFEAVLKLTDYEPARMQVATINLKKGALDAAQATIEALLKTNKKHAEALKLRASIAETMKQVAAAAKASKAKQWSACLGAATAAIEHSPNSFNLRKLRADCLLSNGDLEEAVADLTRCAALEPSSSTALLRLARLNYLYLGAETERWLQPLQQCMRYDPDSKPCKIAIRTFRALDKDRGRARNFLEGSQWRAAADVMTGKAGLVDRLREALVDVAAEGDFSDPSRSRLLTSMLADTCKAQIRAGSIRAAAAVCEETLKRDPDNLDGLIGRGEELMRREEYEDAVRTLTAAFEKSGRSSQDIADRVNKAQKLLKRSKQKDYYKVLGVSKDADERTIKKAYRRGTLKYHPDKQGGSEAKMAELNQAHEVLSNPELRARYDAGDDPNDPTAQQQGGNPFAHHGGAFFQQSGQGGFPFQQFFQQGAGGGGQRFHFNFG